MIKNKKVFISFIVSLILLVILFCLALVMGRFKIKLSDFFNALFTNNESYLMPRSIILNLRLPRTIVALLSGISLSLSGLLYQEVFQNKLVSPDLLGVSNGCGVGASLAIVLGLGQTLVTVFSFTLGIITVLITVVISRIFRRKMQMTLVLSGIIVGGLMSSFLSLIKYFADEQTQLADITYWLMGSFQDTIMSDCYIIAPIVLILTIMVFLVRGKIDVVSLGEEEAKTRGLNYNLWKYAIVAVSTLLTAITVSFSGTISWIGLVIPHIVRMISNKSNRYSIPLTITFGALFMVLVDILSRTFTSSEIPLSAVTGLIGTIIFIIILSTKKEGLNYD